jgi:predicted RNA-binding protein (virulence factor B family)
MKNELDYDYRPAPGALKVQQAVELEVIAETDLGYKAAIDDRYIGLIYRSEISQPLRIGQYLKGWVKEVRPDGKIDLSITRLDSESREDLDEDILRHLRKNGAEPLSDKTPSEDIFRLFGTSKKNFKRAVGRLYKSRAVVITDERISIADKVEKPARLETPARVEKHATAGKPISTADAAKPPSTTKPVSPWKKK